MSFANSEQLYGIKLTTIQSGTYTNVTSGQGVLFGVVSFIASGAGFISGGSISGTVVTVYNAVSGITNPVASGGGVLYYFNYGAQSGAGAGTGGVAVLAPDQWLPQPFLSGLNVTVSGLGSSVQGLTLSWRQGI